MILLIGLVLLFGLIGCFFNPFVGMLTLMGVNMVQPGQLYPIFNALHVERIAALLTIAIVLMRGPRFAFPRVTQWCLIFYGAVLASIPLSFWISNAVANALDFGKTIILSVLLVTLATTRRRLRAVLLTFSALVTYLAVTSLVAYFQGNFQFRMGVDRAVGLTSASNNPDTLGLTIVTAVPLMFLFTLKSNPAWLRWVMRALMLLCLWALLLTGSRGTVLTMVLILALAAVIYHRRWLVAPVAVSAVLAIWLVLPAQYQARYATVNHLQNDESYQNRLISWEGGWHMFLSNPITGIGIGDYTFANGGKFWPAPGHKVYLNAHSLYFQTLGELGLCGIFGFGGLLFVLFKTNAELKTAMAGEPELPAWMRHYPLACNLSLIGLLYCGYAYHDLYRSTWYFLAATSGSLFLVRQAELAGATVPVASDSSLAAEESTAVELAPIASHEGWATEQQWETQR